MQDQEVSYSFVAGCSTKRHHVVGPYFKLDTDSFIEIVKENV